MIAEISSLGNRNTCTDSYYSCLSLKEMCLDFNMKDSDDFDIAKREILLRRIAPEVLLQSGDKTSRVLPVKKISENKYQISFENEFTYVVTYAIKIKNALSC